MQKDNKEITPGSAEYWDRFYSDGSKPSKLGAKEDDEEEEDEEALVHWNEDLLQRFDWFMPFENYWPSISTFFQSSGIHRRKEGDEVVDSDDDDDDDTKTKRQCRLLHVGCGNSMFSEELLKASAKGFSSGGQTGGKGGGRRGKGGSGRGGKGKAASQLGTVASSDFPEFDILNTDICVSIMQTLRETFAGAPGREYAVGDVCSMVSTAESKTADKTMPTHCSDSAWWRGLHVGSPEETSVISRDSVDLVFDKGTIDALLSGFASGRGDAANPNVMAYISESLKVLRKPSPPTTTTPGRTGGGGGGATATEGGRMILLSINAKEIVEPYFYLAGTDFSSEDEEEEEEEGNEYNHHSHVVGEEVPSSVGPTFGFQLEHYESITYDRKLARAQEMDTGAGQDGGAAQSLGGSCSNNNDGEKKKKIPDQDWIHSYGTTYTVFVFKVVAE